MIRQVLLVISIVAYASAVHAGDQVREALLGSWEGMLQAGGTQLTVRFHIGKDETGTLTGTMDSPDQGVTGLPVASVSLSGRDLDIDIAAVAGKLTGRISEHERRIEGHWHQAGQSFDIALRPIDPEQGSIGDSTGLALDRSIWARVAGYWRGELQTPGAALALGLEFTQPGVPLRVFLDSPDQGVEGIPATDLSHQDGRLTIQFASLAAELRLTLGSETLPGTWIQAGQEMPIEFARAGRPEPPARPQTPEPPFPYDAQTIRFPSMTGDFELAGTLLVPDTAPAAAVVLVTGSGPQDRDESIAGHRPFLVLADSLARRGIAVLRYDDRGVGESGGDHGTASLSDFTDDAAAAVKALRANLGAREIAIGMIGHSEGGMIAPGVANREQLDFVVLLAAPGILVSELLPLQQRLILEAGNADADSTAQSIETTRQLLRIIEDEPDDAQARRKIRSLFARRTGETNNPEMSAEQIEQAADAAIRRTVNPWFRELITVDPLAEMRRIQGRVLALYGQLDLQVPPGRNAEPVRQALGHLPSSAFSVETLPGLNHLFQPAQTGHPSEYAQIETTISPDALKRIGDWIDSATASSQVRQAMPASSASINSNPDRSNRSPDPRAWQQDQPAGQAEQQHQKCQGHRTARGHWHRADDAVAGQADCIRA